MCLTQRTEPASNYSEGIKKGLIYPKCLLICMCISIPLCKAWRFFLTEIQDMQTAPDMGSVDKKHESSKKTHELKNKIIY